MTVQISWERLEAPPGFEPGVEVLQSGLAITKLLSRLAFWSALILVLPRFRRVLFPSCSQVHFPRKLLIFDLRFDRLHQVRHERVRPRLAAAAPGRTRTATALNTLLNPFRPNGPLYLRCPL